MQDYRTIILRTLIQGSLTFRSQLEGHIQDGNARAIDIAKNHLEWLKHFSIYAEMEEGEQEYIDMQAGTWNNDLILECFWKVESFKALLWIANAYETMPSFHDVGDVSKIYSWIQYPNDPIGFIDSCSIRTAHEIKQELELYQFLHWRCRTELLRLQGMVPPQGDSFESTVKRALKVLPKGSTNVDHDTNDLLINGVTFTDFDDKGTIMSSCLERRIALEWVMGDVAWSETPTDT